MWEWVRERERNCNSFYHVMGIVKNGEEFSLFVVDGGGGEQGGWVVDLW